MIEHLFSEDDSDQVCQNLCFKNWMTILTYIKDLSDYFGTRKCSNSKILAFLCFIFNNDLESFWIKPNFTFRVGPDIRLDNFNVV